MSSLKICIQMSELAKKPVKLIGEALDHHPLTKNEFTLVLQYLVVNAMYENGKVKRFEAVHTNSINRWTILVDEHKTPGIRVLLKL